MKTFDWSSIEIYLQNDEGKVEERAELTSNGFYLIPIKKRKNYKLMIRSAAKIYRFSPSSYGIDLASMPESEAEVKYNSQSFNFELSGFTLGHRVKFLGEKTTIDHRSKANIGVILIKDSKTVATAVTNSDGEVTFDDITPGTYDLQVNEASKKKEKFASTTYTCTYSWEKGSSCKGGIQLAGLKLSREVTLSGQPLDKGYILLKGKSGQDLSACKKDADKFQLNLPKGFECISNLQQGHFTFDSLPLGSYDAKLYFKNKYTVVEPNSIKISHPDQSNSAEALNFIGYSEGQICQLVTPKGEGIKDVEVKIDGEKQYVTDSQGKFTLNRLKLGNYYFEAVHPHYVFKPFNLIVDGDTEKVLERITADLITLCGRVDFAQTGSENSSGFNVNVQIENNDTKEKRNTKINQDGSYCYELPAGTYTVKAMITQQDKRLSVIPKERVVSLYNKPDLAVNFSREKLTIKGTIKYPFKLPQAIKDQTTISLINEKGQSVKKTSGSGEQGFQFSDLFEDGYSVRVENQNVCFKQSELKADSILGKGEEFEAKGVLVKYKTDVKFIAKINEKQAVTFSHGSHQICLPGDSKIEIQAMDHFTFKQGMNKVVVDTSNPKELKELVFEMEKVRLKGKVKLIRGSNSKVEIIKLSQLTPKSISIKVKDSVGKISTYPVTQVNDREFEYSLDTALRDKLTFQLDFKILGESLIVKPESGRFTLDRFSGKIYSLPQFRISLGKHIEGDLSKQMKDVKLTILRRQLNTGSWRAFKRFTVSGNKFKYGPYSNKYQYSIKLSKTGANFDLNEVEVKNSEDSAYKVHVSEISRLELKVVSSASGAPIPDVSVYITSTERGNYFKTSINTNQRGRALKFIHKGEYFIKSVLKEYEFDPPQSLIKIEENQKVSLTIKAKRTQFSAHGSVKSLGGFQINDIKVEATCEESDNILVESGNTDKFGNFVIKGLIPGKTYTLKAMSSNSQALMVQDVHISVGNKDSTGVGVYIIQHSLILASEWKVRALSGTLSLTGFTDT